MVGCSALNCTNRSDKGFKTYRIPRDPSRREEWIRFIGRDGWIPGSGASLCEAHFEASAYELHRADGLKKLKQNAIPTVYVSNPIKRSKRKQSVQPRLEFHFDEDCDDSFIPEDSEMGVEDGHFLSVNTYGCGFDGIHERPSQVKRLKAVHVMEIISKPTSKNEVLPVVKVKQRRHLKRRGRTKVLNRQGGESNPNNYDGVQEINSAKEASTCIATQPVESGEVVTRCFVCSKVIAPGFDVHLSVPAEASRTLLHQCLNAVLGFENSVDDGEVVCRRCCSLLNFIDRVEAELKILKGAISACTKENSEEQDLSNMPRLVKSEQILERFSRGLGERSYVMDLEELFLEKADAESTSKEFDLCHPVADVDESLSRDGSAEESMVFPDKDSNDESFKKAEDLRHISELEWNEEKNTANECFDQPSIEPDSIGEGSRTCEISRSSPENVVESVTCSGRASDSGSCSRVVSLERTAYIDEDLKCYLGSQQKTHECKICSFKTVYESVMIWHLRIHMKTHRWCDFCSVAIPEKEPMFEQPKKSISSNKSKTGKGNSKPRFILPAVPVESITVSPIPLPSISVPLLPLEESTSESPVVLVETQDLSNELVPESVMDEVEDEKVKMEEIRDSGVVIMGENIHLSESSKLLQSSIASTDSNSSKIDKGLQEKYCNENSLSPVGQGSEELELYCGILRPPADQIGKVVHSDADLNECLSNCCNVNGNDVVESLSREPCTMTSSECIHPNDGLEDSLETNFLDTLPSQPVTKYPEILPDICDEANNPNAMSAVVDVTDDNITSNDVNFARNNAIGDLALAYESSVAALMCQSDDSDGILY
ncbi:uncharacterized protein [Hetaerina americana]|uniref:uncharacterized protein isoform X2 n=1 Tax=Hetaerina americana TaxID=62018 RepID=UPI003A7F3BF8